MDRELHRRRLEPPQGKVSAVLDTDTYNEIDDQFALAYAWLSPERLSLDAIYAAPFQNPRSDGPGDGMRRSHAEILRVLGRLGASAEERVFLGSERFLGRPDDPVESEAARDLVERAMSRSDDDPLYVVAIAAITNVASALLMEPRVAERIVVVWLCGQPHSWGTTVEFNLCQDPVASRIVFDCGVPLVHVPCGNVAEHLRTTVPELDRYVRGQGALGDYLFEIFRDYAADRPAWSKPLWDVAAVAWLVDPSWIPTELVPSPCLTPGHTWRHDPNRHPIRVAERVDRDAVFGDLFRKVEMHARGGA
jgi:inosine-uridine nucleoside N-ribohydrolase